MPSDRVDDRDLPNPALQTYRSKRNFAATPEPQGGAAPGQHGQLFVVQKHWASSLHYDLRLALGGTLKSWAVPKGPSLDPTVKRMAVQVEDHPMAYARFEGTVPARQYGAGRVIVWDIGTWTALVDPAQGYRDGNLKFELHGHKLHGRWVLVRMQGQGAKQPPWLLIKERDAFARPAADYSVVDALPDSVQALGPPPRGTSANRPECKQAGKAPAGLAAPGAGLPPGAVPAELPDKLLPQLATLVSHPAPSNPADWLYEIKFDGYRLLVRIDGAGARLVTRNGHDWTAKLRPLQQALDRMALPPGWYDGEIVVPDAAGIPDFGALQQAFEARQTAAVLLYLFDLPYCHGHDLRSLPLQARRDMLQRLLRASPSAQVRFSEVFDAPPDSLLASACKLGLEGIIAKRRQARYQAGRSGDWIKLKCSQRQAFVIGGFTDPQGQRTGLGALLLGVHDAQGALRYVGDVGTGFSQPALLGIKKALNARRRASSPFDAGTKINRPAHWVAPTLVAEVTFGEWTRAGRVRHAVFRGLRSDKDAAAIVRVGFRCLCSRVRARGFSVCQAMGCI